jgi:putative addiction module CopG family antidote
MSYAFPQDVQDLIAQQMASGRYSSEDDVLRDALVSLSQSQEDLDAVLEAVAELEAGDPGVPLGEAFNIIRKKHGLPCE